MDKFRKSQIETLVRTGLMPVQYLPWLERALEQIKQDAFLPLNHRKIFYDFVEKLMDLAFNDPMIYRLLRQRVGMGKYEQVSEEEIDLKRTPEGMLDQLASSSKGKKKAGGHVSTSEKRLASKAKAELRRRRDNKKGREETKKQSMHESYEKAFLDTLKSYNVNSISDLPTENVKEFFNKVEQLYKSGE
jgi:hypothetical protein